MSTDRARSSDRSIGEGHGALPADPPAPLAATALAEVPGVLGRIALERLADYDASGWRGAAEAAGVAAQASPHSFEKALRRGDAIAVIAEIKSASPSKGRIARLDPAAAARAYERGGAAALSVLTEPRHFAGDVGHLRAAGHASSLPLLRKDFTVHPAQLVESAEAGASAVLLIVAVLRERTADYLAYARRLGLDALVEVHDEAELDIAVAAGARIIGANNRDLRTLDIDPSTAPRLLALARDAGFDGVLVAESGYGDRSDLEPVAGLAHAVLVGTSLAGSGDLEGALRRFRGETQ